MVWRIDDSRLGFCKSIPGYDQFPAYVVCITSSVPETKYASFDAHLFTNLFANLKFEIEDNERILPSAIGHQLPCAGDSGGGHWIAIGKKSVLIGINTMAYTGVNGVCGDASAMQTTTDNNILKWIKQQTLF